jgi:hypothetical protein
MASKQDIASKANDGEERGCYPTSTILLSSPHRNKKHSSPWPPRQVAEPSRTHASPHQGLLGANVVRSPPWHKHRLKNGLFLRPRGQAIDDQRSTKAPHRTSYKKLAITTSLRLTITRGASSILFLVIPPRATMRDRRQVGRQGPDDPTTQTRHAIVDKDSHSVERYANSATYGDCLPSHRQLGLRGGERYLTTTRKQGSFGTSATKRSKLYGRT